MRPALAWKSSRPSDGVTSLKHSTRAAPLGPADAPGPSIAGADVPADGKAPRAAVPGCCRGGDVCASDSMSLSARQRLQRAGSRARDQQNEIADRSIGSNKQREKVLVVVDSNGRMRRGSSAHSWTADTRRLLHPQPVQRPVPDPFPARFDRPSPCIITQKPPVREHDDFECLRQLGIAQEACKKEGGPGCPAGGQSLTATTAGCKQFGTGLHLSTS